MPSDDARCIADALHAIASALRSLGTGNAATEMGAIEVLASEVRQASELVANAIHVLARREEE